MQFFINNLYENIRIKIEWVCFRLTSLVEARGRCRLVRKMLASHPYTVSCRILDSGVPSRLMYSSTLYPEHVRNPTSLDGMRRKGNFQGGMGGERAERA